MATLMTIGEFSRATRLSARALRLYHRQGLLVPHHVDEATGYRSWSTDQLPDALLVRRLRAWDMTLEDIGAVLGADSPAGRDEVIARHRDRMRDAADRARDAVAGLQQLLDGPTSTPTSPSPVEHRTVPATTVVALREVIDLADLGPWYDAGVLLLDGLVAGGAVVPCGHRGGSWSTELVVDERGEAALFLPVARGTLATADLGRARVEVLPAVSLAVAVHRGPDAGIGQVYAELGRYVAQRGIGVDGPVRETYLQGPAGPDHTGTTEIGWPIRPGAPGGLDPDPGAGTSLEP